MNPSPSPRRQARLSTKALITWGAILAAWLGHRLAPDSVSELLPFAIFVLSRPFLWPAFPRAGRIIWPVFLAAQLLLFVGPQYGMVVSLIATSVWMLATLGGFAFLIANDLGHVFRRIRGPRQDELES